MKFGKSISDRSYFLFIIINLSRCAKLSDIYQPKKLFDINIHLFLYDKLKELGQGEIRETNIDDFKEDLRKVCFEKEDLINEYFYHKTSSYERSEVICKTIIKGCFDSFYKINNNMKKFEFKALSKEIYLEYTGFKDWVFLLHTLHPIMAHEMFPTYNDNSCDPSLVQDDDTGEIFFGIINIFYSAIPQRLISFLYKKFMAISLTSSVTMKKCVYKKSEYSYVLSIFNLSNATINKDESSRLDIFIKHLRYKNNLCKLVFELSFDFEYYYKSVKASDLHQNSTKVDNIEKDVLVKTPKLLKEIIYNLFMLIKIINFPVGSVIEVKFNITQIIRDIYEFSKNYQVRSFDLNYAIVRDFYELSNFYFKKFIRIGQHITIFLEFNHLGQDFYLSSQFFRCVSDETNMKKIKYIMNNIEIFEKTDKKNRDDFWMYILDLILLFFKETLDIFDSSYNTRCEYIFNKIKDEFYHKHQDDDFFSFGLYKLWFYDILYQANKDEITELICC